MNSRDIKAPIMQIHVADMIVTTSGEVLKNRFGSCNIKVMVVDEEGNVLTNGVHSG